MVATWLNDRLIRAERLGVGTNATDQRVGGNINNNNNNTQFPYISIYIAPSYLFDLFIFPCFFGEFQ